MWLPEGSTTGDGNIYENHGSVPTLVTAFVHNETGNKGNVRITVPQKDNIINLAKHI